MTSSPTSAVLSVRLPAAGTSRGIAGGHAGLETDGPRHGATQLKDSTGNGENSTTVCAVGPARQMYTSWVTCPNGKTALGGFSRNDEGETAYKGLQVMSQ